VIGSKPTILGNCKYTDPEALKNGHSFLQWGDIDIEIIHGQDGSHFGWLGRCYELWNGCDG
jgi:hypothetical protein